MSVLKVDLLNPTSLEIGLSVIIARMKAAGVEPISKEVEPANEPSVEIQTTDLSDEELLNNSTDDGMGDLDDLMGEPEPEGVTVEDMKVAFQGLMDAKGRDVTKALINKAFTKMGVKKLEEIPEEKREAFVQVLNNAATK